MSKIKTDHPARLRVKRAKKVQKQLLKEMEGNMERGRLPSPELMEDVMAARVETTAALLAWGAIVRGSG